MECRKTVDFEWNRRPAQGSVRQRKPIRKIPCRIAQSKANQRRIITKTLSRCLSFEVVGVSGRIACFIGHRGHDAFLVALADQALRVRIQEKDPKNLDDALNLASRLEEFDIMSSTGSEAEKGKSRFVRAAAGGKESTGSGETKLSEEILKQLADLKGLVCSYR